VRQTLIVDDRNGMTFSTLLLVEGETPYLYRPVPLLFADADRWCVEIHAGPPAPNPAHRRRGPDHPHTDPGDGRTECETCGKFVWPATHSCKRVPVTDAARARAALHGRSVTITPGVWTSVAGGVAVIHHEPGPVTVRVIATPTETPR
jgi:hypothetical protein